MPGALVGELIERRFIRQRAQIGLLVAIVPRPSSRKVAIDVAAFAHVIRSAEPYHGRPSSADDESTPERHGASDVER